MSYYRDTIVATNHFCELYLNAYVHYINILKHWFEVYFTTCIILDLHGMFRKEVITIRTYV